MKKISAILLLLVAFLLTGNAQNPQGKNPGKEGAEQNPAEHAKRSADTAQVRLGLDDSQKQKWEAAENERFSANAPLRGKLQGSTTPDERRNIHKELQSNNQKFEEQVRTFLSPEQFSKFQALKAEKKEKKGKRKHAKE